jgi:O-antigen/teichoic acid export membrane protein
MGNVAALIARHRHINWALADQAVVSGSNFITGILLARFLGPQSFGVYVLLQTALIYVNSFQGALIFQPMMSAAPQLGERQRSRYLKGVFALQLILCFGLAALAWVVGTSAHWLWGGEPTTSLTPPVVLSLSCALLAFQLQEWLRRYYFVLEMTRAVFINDVVNYGAQVAILGIAYLSGHLDVVTAFWIMAAACFCTFLLGFLRGMVKPVFSDARAVLRDGWRTGRDYLAAWQLQWVGSQGVLVVGAGMVGVHAAAGVRAAETIVGPLNILFQAMENVVPVVAARKYDAGGVKGLSSYLTRVTLWGTALLLPIVVAAALFSLPLMRFVYGEQYVIYAALVVWGAASVFVQFYLRVVFFFLRTVMATGIIVRAGVVMAVVSISVAAFAVREYHETGIMVALLSSAAGGLIYSALAARRVASGLGPDSRPSPVFDSVAESTRRA